MISMVLPDIAVTTSPGLKAWPSGMFSQEQTTQRTRTLSLSWAMARMVAIMVAAPAMSYFILSMSAAGLMEMPPVSKVMPLPMRPMRGALAGGGVGGSGGREVRAGGWGEAW